MVSDGGCLDFSHRGGFAFSPHFLGKHNRTLPMLLLTVTEHGWGGKHVG
jgi:hypothetical protein